MPAASATTSSPVQQSKLSRLDLAAPRGVAEIGSIALGGLLFGVLGFAMEWRPGYIVAAALAFAFSTWLARSIGRALICSLGSLGLIAGVMVLVAGLAPRITETLGVGWGAMFLIWWLVAVLLALTFRLSGAKAEFNLPLAVGCAVSLAIALFVAAKLNFQANLLFYIVSNEDNAAWVGLASQNAFASSIAAQFNASTLGPAMPLLLGVLSGAQKPGIAPTNAVFAAYTLAVVTSPLLAASLLRGAEIRSRIASIAFTLIVFAWLFLIPALLYRDFGHLSTIWAAFAFIAFASLVAFDAPKPILIAAAFGLLLLMGGAWFPIAPFAAALALAYALLGARESAVGIRIGIVVLFALAAIAIVLQLRSSGVAVGTNLGEFARSLEGLYKSTGGVAQLDTVLRVLVLVGVVGLAFLLQQIGYPGRALFVLVAAGVAYVIAVYAGSALLNVGTDSYGATKVAFVLLFSTAVILVALVPQLDLDRNQMTAAGLALTLGALTFGGGTLLLTRAWPGDGTFPTWLPLIESVVKSQKEPRPIVCFAANDGKASYDCTRWAGALTAAGDGAFVDYRLAIVNSGQGIEAVMANLAAARTLQSSDVIFLQRPIKGTWWGPTLLRDGGRVFGPTGKPLKRRSISAIELLPPPAPAK